ncbi:unnamed protein product [Notodromas monacha]|uniref:Uncharacterized protein n=1 Tax=Notodromas monacha TaxID=399045 RepID=A0A7R9GCS1_9CRUS|nr:unnamed protein product [Notodromas monacha]CAG0916258.1 unnamed protein product [Notodromas monacha]
MATWAKKRVPELATVWSIKDTFKTAFGSSAKLAAEAMPCMVFIAYACLVVVQNLLATLQEAGRMFVRILCCSVGALGSTLPTRVFLNPEAMARNQTKPTESWQNLRQQLAIRCGLSDEFLAAAVASLTPPTRRDDVLDMLSLIDNPVDDGYDSAVDEFIGPELDFDNPLRVPLNLTRQEEDKEEEEKKHAYYWPLVHMQRRRIHSRSAVFRFLAPHPDPSYNPLFSTGFSASVTQSPATGTAHNFLPDPQILSLASWPRPHGRRRRRGGYNQRVITRDPPPGFMNAPTAP